MNLPKSYILPWLAPRKKQYGPTCTAFATSYLFEFYDHNYNNAPYKPFSTAFFFGIDPHKPNSFNLVLDCVVLYGGVYLADFDNRIEEKLEAIAAVKAERERLLALAKNQCWFDRADDTTDVQQIKKFIISYQLPVMTTIDTGDVNHAIACVGWDDRDRLVFLDTRLKDELLVRRDFLTAFLVYPKVKPLRFPDMPDWAYDAITWAAAEGGFSGYTDGTFKPDNMITWAESLKAVLLCAGYDVQQGVTHWADGYASFAYENGMIDNAPNLDGSITRLEAAQLIAKAYKIQSTSAHPFSDTKQDVYVAALYKLGVVQGYPDGTFRPGENLTRAELVTMLYRLEGMDA